MFEYRNSLQGQVASFLVIILTIIIIAVGVALPVISEIVENSNVTGIPAVIIGFFTMIVAISLLVIITSGLFS